ncbi:hypothetical protein M9H77_30021 [Catharanthus roseus]|uniref:Uncharacterized protein n=1 Tax=Catharanthus roseus TaxID=4058 RepID=A0ACB9ZWW4_CATRO|nr:hypothetical protein M9H77_30021 [Catharanthus roseus]
MMHFMDSKSLSSQDVLVIRANSDDPMKAATILTTYKTKYSFSRDNDDLFHEGFATRNNEDIPYEGFVNEHRLQKYSFSRDNNDVSHEGFFTTHFMKDFPS